MKIKQRKFFYDVDTHGNIIKERALTKWEVVVCIFCAFKSYKHTNENNIIFSVINDDEVSLSKKNTI